MRKYIVFLFALLLPFAASAEVWHARYGVAETFDFKLYNADGTLDVDEVDGGTEVSLSCDEGAETTATNDFADEGNFYSIALTAAELKCERVAVVIAATTTEVFFIETSALDPGVVTFGTAQSATGTTIVLAASTSFADDLINGATVVITGGTGAGQSRVITDWVSSTDTATVATWTTNPDSTSVYEVYATPSSTFAADSITASVIADNAIDAGAIATDAITAAKIAADAVGASELATDAIGAAEIAADAVGAAEIANAAIDAATFAAGAVDASAIATDAIGAAELAANAIGSSELAALEQLALADAAVINCTVNTAFFAGSTTTVACILTDRDGGAITAASNDLEGRELLVLSGAQIYEGRYITDSTWDGVNSELQLTLSRALPGTLADAVTAIIR